MKKYLLILSCFFFVQQSFGQTNYKIVTDFIEQEMQSWNIPNVSIAIVNKDSLLFQKEYGQDKSHGNYLIGSISKSFTATAVMQLYEKGALVIDTPVMHYLPWFELRNKTISDEITVRHLLNQTSGFAKGAGFFTPKSQVQAEIEQEYKIYLQSLNIYEAGIGKTHIYSNLNYQILGQLIQKVSGLQYGEYVKKHIFAPLGMQNSFASYDETKKAGLKNGYQYFFGFLIKRSFTYNNNGIAAGDIASNTEDMSKFLQAWLNNGKGQNDTVIGKSLLGQMHRPFSNRNGMGFSIGDWNGLHSIKHTGLSKNSSSAINILPNENY
jgi:CubicO group peptidase (beta-lactamase class C family)